MVGILVLLAALLFPAITSLLRRAELARAQNEVNLIANAVRQYFHQTGRLPLDDPSSHCRRTSNWVAGYDSSLDHPDRPSTLHSASRAALSNLAEKLTDPQSNPARRTFLDMEPGPHGMLLDPWGNPYAVQLDCTGEAMRGVMVVVISAGPDGVFNVAEHLGGGRQLRVNLFGADDDIRSRH